MLSIVFDNRENGIHNVHFIYTNDKMLMWFSFNTVLNTTLIKIMDEGYGLGKYEAFVKVDIGIQFNRRCL